MEKIIRITAFEIYLLSLIKMEYINMENSFVGDDGKIYLNLNMELLPTPDIEIKKNYGLTITYHSVKDVFEQGLFEICIFERSSYYIVCDNTGLPINIKAKSRLGMLGVLNRPDIISSIMEDMSTSNHPDYAKYQKQLQEFKEAVKL